MNVSTNPKLALIKGALWTVGTRWAVKAIAFLNTVVMARLILPADYGIVAMAMLVVGMIQAMMDFGAATALLRKGAVTDDFVNSAWTMRVLQSAGIALMLVASSWGAQAYFDEPRVQPVIWVLALCIVIEGASNIGLVLAQKSFKFSVDFKVQILSKLTSVAATLVFGYWLRDYRALVAGIATSILAGFVLSYALHPYRPRWCIRNIPEIWAVTKWLMLATMGSFLFRKADEALAGRLGTTAQFGAYSVGAELGRMPVSEVGPAMVRAFLPVLSSIQSDAARTRSAVIKTLAAVNTLTLPVGIGVCAVAPLLTVWVLGARWAESSIYVALFALIASARFAVSPLESLLILLGHTRVQTTVVWVEAVVFVGAALLLVPQHGLPGLAWARLVATCFSAVFTAVYAKTRCELAIADMFPAVVRPLVGAALMYVLVQMMLDSGPGPDVWRLFLAVLGGAAFFAVWSFISWRLAGKPEGLESTVWDLIATRYTRNGSAK